MRDYQAEVERLEREVPRQMPSDFAPVINVDKVDGAVIITGAVDDATLSFEVKTDGIEMLPDSFRGLKRALWEYVEMKRLAGEGVQWAIEVMGHRSAA